MVAEVPTLVRVEVAKRTSLAALSPASTAPFMYPGQTVAVSVPAKYTFKKGSRSVLRTTIADKPRNAVIMSCGFIACALRKEDDFSAMQVILLSN